VAASPLSPEALYRRCDPAGFSFQTTAELEPLAEALGQERAVEALRFGAAMRRDGYHIFVLGPSGAGKRRLAERLLRERASREPVPSDWCYLHDFGDPQRPLAVPLPPGAGARFRADLDALVDELRAAVPAAFESDEYRTRLQMMQKQLEEEREQAMSALSAKGRERGVGIVRTPLGLAVAPVRDGEVVEPDAFHKLPAEEQARIQKDLTAMQEELAALVRSFPANERKHRDKVKEMNREVALYAVGHLIDEVRKRHQDLPAVVAHLDAVQKDVVENVHDFLAAADGGEEALSVQMRRLFTETPVFRRYQVNVLVDRTGLQGAPLIFEDLPTHAALAGRMEHHVHFGAMVTDFTLLRAGALHRANGGYLLLDARRLLQQPFAWEELKRALRSGLARIEPAERRFGFGSGSTLEPRPIPLALKVVLFGERILYYLLAELDPEFSTLFKIAADFEDQVDREGEGELRFARVLARLAQEEKLRPLDRGAAARVTEQAARLAGDAGKLTARMDEVADLLRESDQVAAEHGRGAVAAEDVQAAIDGQVRRADRIRKRMLEVIAQGTVLIDTAGSKVGQVNGLSVISLGRMAFGQPSRITARVRLGKGEVVDIEREVELGGPIHSKGVLILAGFLGSRYAADRPFTLSASLVFEQSYGGVEGDSASSAELYALLSALADAPLKQSLAVTGSVNQLGQVQAVGGVNEKIEGFFDVCRERGLTGEEGVLIPAANARHLMLRADVVEAARQGRFRVWPVESIDQGLELLTGLPAGERGPDGRFPPQTLNGRVAARLEALAEAARAFGAGKDEKR
jgi:lon-related putative ATP-dependent protease